MKTYSSDEVRVILVQAFETAEQDIFKGLAGASNEDRLNSLDTLDALEGARRQVEVILNRDFNI